MDLIKLIFILVTLIKCVLGRERLKWFAYCHFLKGETSIEMLSCGKCLYQEQLRFYLNNNSNQRSVFKSQINSKYCSYYYSRLNKHQHTINRNEEELPLLPYLDSNWFAGHLTNLIQKEEISTNLDDLNILNEIPTNLKIIELIDFGIEKISLNAFKHFTNLRVLNLAFNSLNTFDFLIFNDSRSSLIELDLSFNKIATIQYQENSMKNLRLLNISNNYLTRFDVKYISSKLQILDLSFNYLKQFTNFVNSSLHLSNLIYLNLNNNQFNNVNELFDDNNNNNSYLFNECVLNRIDVYLYNNNWKCDCESFEFFLKLEQSKECLNSKLKLIVDNQIDCKLDESITYNWFYWYNSSCNNSNEQNKLLTKPSDQVGSTQQFYFFWNTPTTFINRPQNITTKTLKYDMSTAFYWVSSFCVAIITISCLFVLWFYCFKRFRLTRNGLIPERIHSPRRQNQRNRNNLNNNNRPDLSRFVIRDPTNQAAPYPMAIYRHFRQGRSDASDLYFISLSNRNSNRVFANTRNQPHLTNLSPQNHDNLGYNHNDDEPPSYYDAILIKNNRLSIYKDNNSLENVSRNYNNILTTNSTTNSTSLNNHQANDLSLVLNPNNLARADENSNLTVISTPISALSRRLESELSDDSLETRTQT